jgi:hypothetical protein
MDEEVVPQDHHPDELVVVVLRSMWVLEQGIGFLEISIEMTSHALVQLLVKVLIRNH